MTFPKAVQSQLDKSLSTDDWFPAAQILRAYQPPTRWAPAVAALIDAFSYRLTSVGGSSREQWGEFVPMHTSEQSSYPPLIEHVEASRLDEWAHLSRVLRHPLVQSRLGDILWIRRYGNDSHLRCREAIQGYLDLGQSTLLDAFHRAVPLIRGSELSLSLSDRSLARASIAALMSTAQEAVANAEPAGVSIRLLASLCRLPSDYQPAGLDTLLQQAQENLIEDPFAFESAVSLQMTRTPQDKLREHALAELLVDRWQHEANLTQGMFKARNLERAIQLATNHGLTERGKALRIALQQIPEEDLGLKSISSTVSVPRGDVEALINRFVEGADWQTALDRFGAYCPVWSDRTAAQDLVQRLRQEAPLAAMMARRVMDVGGVHVKTFATPDERFGYDMTRQEVINITWWGTLAVQVLERISTLEPSLAAAELAAYFETPFISPSVSSRIAVAFEHYQNGHYDDALFVLLPRIESVIREMARQVGMVIIREPRGDKPGGYRLLGDLLWEMRTVLAPENVPIYLYTLLADPVGINLRNDAMHGLIEEGTQHQAALAMHAICLLKLFRLRPTTAESPLPSSDGQ